MKESILDVLLYLFEHYFTNDALPPVGDRLLPDQEGLQGSPLFSELTEAGFSPAEIQKAFDWLDALAEQRPVAAAPRRRQAAARRGRRASRRPCGSRRG